MNRIWQGQFERLGMTCHDKAHFWLYSYVITDDGGFCNGCILKRHWHLSEHLFTNVAYNDLVSQLSDDKILQ
jgi:hypothetical protein